MKRGETTKEILDSAERMIRTGGYNAFSYRDVAADIGIKAASVHYHYPGKENLGAAVASRYADRFMAALGDPADAETDPEILLQNYIGMFRAALVEEGLMCLCGMLGAEVRDLPESVAKEAKIFFERNLIWLDVVLGRQNADLIPKERRKKAIRILAVLEGGMMLARSLDDHTVFDDMIEEIFSIQLGSQKTDRSKSFGHVVCQAGGQLRAIDDVKN